MEVKLFALVLAVSATTQKAVSGYQITNGLQPSGYLDSDTLAVMGLQ